MRRRSARACAALLALAALATADGSPSDGPTFTGRLAPGGSETLALPAAPKGFWRVVLEGEVGGVDLDLRVEAGGKRLGTSQGEQADEELLVPAMKGLTATIDHYDGPATGFTLRCEAVAPAKRLTLGKEVRHRADAAAAAWQVHELPATGTKFCRVELSAPGADEGVDLDLFVHDAAWRQVAASQGEAADEAVVVSPSREARWVVVRAYAGAADHTLSVTPVGEGARRVSVDDTLRDTLEPGGERYYRLRTTQAGIVTVRLEGPPDQDFDLYVLGPDGYHRESIAEDAVEEIAINGARRGDYLIQVVAADEGAGGEFSLALERLDVSRLQSSGKGGSKVWGLFVGIAQYVEVESLTYTAGDALSIYQLLRARGEVDRRRSIVLLDEPARRRDVVRALEEIARRADEDDVFVFFYSGHGGNDAPDGERGDPKDERDGGDEYLVCYDSTAESTDGDLIDDDLAQLLERIACRRQLLVFDACHAGGFAELIDREGRWGCFSSLESQTSTEALALKRGLLTAIVLRALNGEADADGDGAVTVRELGAFVERVQPNTCAACQAEDTPAMTRCRACGEDLTAPDARQIPVIVGRGVDELVLARPGRRAREGRQRP